jgi:hypothetical protein
MPLRDDFFMKALHAKGRPHTKTVEGFYKIDCERARPWLWHSVFSSISGDGLLDSIAAGSGCIRNSAAVQQ